MEKKTIILKRQKAPDEVQAAIDRILYELETCGRSITTNGKASRFLSFRLQPFKQQEKIFFQRYNVRNGTKRIPKNIITLAPNFKLEIISKNKIKLELKTDTSNNGFSNGRFLH